MPLRLRSFKLLICVFQVKSHAYALGITDSPSEDPLKHPEPFDIHLHLPAGAQRKDGPSAGIALGSDSLAQIPYGLLMRSFFDSLRICVAVDRLYCPSKRGDDR